MRTVVFLVKNGIGFGHIRRALLIADAVNDARQVRPVIISQAHSLALYNNTRTPVVNFPLLHRVPSAVTEDWYTEQLDQLLNRLDPALVIEDTYPDARYARLPSLADRPRMLVMRRLDGASFDHIRTRGDLDRYQQILIAQDAAQFAREGHSGDTLTAVEVSGRFTFTGNLAHTPDPAAVAAVRAEYAPHGEPLVVVNGGAGGDQMPDGYGDRLFGACHLAATRLAAEGSPARFVLVTGPYYAGRPFSDSRTVIVRRFEPRLSALLAAATVAVIKPGNNALSEALTGSAHLVLVPDVSFMEGLDEHAARIVTDYAGTVTTPEVRPIYEAVSDALTTPPRTRRAQNNNRSLDHVADVIGTYGHPQTIHQVPSKHLLLLIRPRAAAGHGCLGDLPTGAIILDHDTATPPAEVELASTALPAAKTPVAPVLMVDCDLTEYTPQSLADRGVRILLHPASATRTLARWLSLHPPQPTMLPVTTTTLLAADYPAERFARAVSRLLDHRVTACVNIDLDRLDDSQARQYLRAIAWWIADQPLHLAAAQDLLACHSHRLLQGSA